VGDVIRGLTYMHSLDVVHGDMKAVGYQPPRVTRRELNSLRQSNVLVDSEGRARLTDFGLATALHATRTSTTTGGAGSLRWMAPELLDPEKYDIPEPDANRPTKESDVYALAITIWEVSGVGLRACTGPPSHRHKIFNSEFPFSKMRDAKVIASVLSGLRPPRNEDVTGPRGLSDEVWASMVGWWDELPPARPMLAQSGSMEE
jgi:serine/threonine protein kinase